MMMGRKTSITVRIPIDLLDRLDAYGESEFGRRFDRSLFIVEAITGRLNGIKEGAHHGCVLSSCYRPVWREFSFRKSGRF